MTIGVFCAVVLVVAVLAVTLRAARPDFALLLGIAAGVLLSMVVLRTLDEALVLVQELLVYASPQGDMAVLLGKALGVCLLTQFTADVCRDAGESALASHAEFAGKCAMLVLALPLFRQLAELAAQLMGAS